MKLDESKIIDIECDHIRTKEAKKITYRGLEIYAVKRSIYTSDTERAFLHRSGINTAWWCGCRGRTGYTGSLWGQEVF